MRNAILLLTIVFLLCPLPAALAAGGGDITFTPKTMDPVHFSHDYHLKLRGLKCAACHFQKFMKGAGYEMQKEQITKTGFCAHCHNGMKAFSVDNEKNCMRCHSKKGQGGTP
jgi:c(7)-type cytochrome triheme protein